MREERFHHVLDALEHDLAPHKVQHVEETQLDAPSFVHATQFDALQGDTDADEEALPADPPPVIHHTMFLNQKEGPIQFQV